MRVVESGCLLLLIVAIAVDGQQTCTTADGKAGNCILLRLCDTLFTLIKKKPLLQEDRAFLSRSQCGWSVEEKHPLVCCSDPLEAPVRVGASLLPSPGVCGLQTSNRIVGGEDTKIDEYPWTALLKYAKPNNVFGFHCGGSLINDRYVITASHCVNGKDIPTTWDLVEVRLGEWDTSTDQDCQGIGVDLDCSPDPQDIAIERKIPHPNYNPQALEQYNDIALLRLGRRIEEFTDFVKPICLPRSAELKERDTVGQGFQVAGWGRTATARYSARKQHVKVDGIGLEQCNQVYQQERVVLLDRQLCAGGQEGKDSCQGDSGGPLMAVTQNERVKYWYLVGLVSFGPTPCGQSGWPGVYTKVAKYVDWVEATLEP